MQRTLSFMIIILVLVVSATAILFRNPPQRPLAPVKIDKKSAKRDAIDQMARDSLQTLLSEDAAANTLADSAAGFAVFDSVKVALLISGGGGVGVAVNSATGQRTYMKMGTGGIGFGLGVNKFQVVFLFQDEATLQKFVENGWQADAGATASAGKNAAEAKTNFVNGLAIYQLTEKGLMLNADLAGTKYWLYDKLNE